MPVNRQPLVAVVLVAIACLAHGPTSARALSVLDMLDRYERGRFDEVAAELSGDIDFKEFLKQIKRDGPRWIEEVGPSSRARRELTAATLALEAARAGEWQEWKWTQKQPAMAALNGESYQPLNVLWWQPPPLLIEWACELFRRDATPRPVERWWQLAALAVAQRSEDAQFLVGDTKIGLGVEAGEIGNLHDEIKHLDHVQARFPNEMRFVLGQGIARDRDWQDDATAVYVALFNDPDVGGEALMRMGAMQMRQGTSRYADALKLFGRVETATRDPYVVFLARYFAAQIHERQRRLEDAEAAYRGAVAAVPQAQSATIALAALLFRDGRRVEAQQLATAMLAVESPPLDPWRAYVHADDRFWPRLIGKLRSEIRP